MGHDILIKNCPKNLTDECIEGGKCSHTTLDDGYISFNYSKFDNYWHIRNAHGHECHLVSKQLSKAIKELLNEGVKSKTVLGNAWLPDKSVFLYHLINIKKLVDKYPNCIVLSDQVYYVQCD